jgi:hypothetical protein
VSDSETPFNTELSVALYVSQNRVMKTFTLFTILSHLLIAALIVGAPLWAQAHTPDPTDIRTLAPPRPQEATSMIAQPESGTDLESVSADWARREVHLVSQGADDRFLADANSKLDRFFETADSSEFLNSSNRDRNPANDENWLRPRTVHMSRLGEIEIGFNGRAKISCDMAGGNGTEWILSKPVSSDLDLQLHHEANSNSLQLRLNW